jgi:hypothetical protein
MATPPRVRVVCTLAAGLRTSVLALLFTIPKTLGATVVPVDPHEQAQKWMAEARRTSNPVRLLMLALDIKEALDQAYAKDPRDPDVLVDLVRFHSVTPKLAGGDPAGARRYAKELSRVDAGLGHFASGYLAYREKQLGRARQELQIALKSVVSPHRELALQWLGWVSQESQQYADAFAAWEQLKASDPKALYEIGRTALFCHCETERGRAAVTEYLRKVPGDEDAKKVLQGLK